MTLIVLLAIVQVLNSETLALTSRAQNVQQVSFDVQGSVPPVPRLYKCAKELEGQAFDPAKAEGCLNKLLSSNLFESGRLSSTQVGSDSIQLTYHLKSPDLTLTAVNLNLTESEKDELNDWLAADLRNLKVGSAYSRDAEVITFYAINQFFRSRGRAVLFNTIVDLDYQTRRASVTYNFVEGPQGPAEPGLPPYGPVCARRIKLLDFTGVDDNVPIPLIDQLMQVRAFSCFDAETLKEDEKRLLGTGFLKEAHFSATEEDSSLSVRLTLKGDSLTVQDIQVAVAGGDVKLTPAQSATLPLRCGDSYKASLANETADALERIFSNSDNKVSVVQDVELLARNRLRLRFDVLALPIDQVRINGHLQTTEP